MTFTTRKLLGSRVLVTGSDLAGTTGSVILDSTQWDEVNQNKQYDEAVAAFDEAVRSFYAPLEAAAEAANEKLVRPEMDPTEYIVVEEGSEGVAPVARQIVKLGHDAQVLRILDSGQTNRLIWVGDNLEILAPDQAAVNTVAAQVPDATEVAGEDLGRIDG